MAACKRYNRKRCLIDSLCDDCMIKLYRRLFPCLDKGAHTIELNITGLESASSVDVHRMAEEFATSLAQKVRVRRRQ